MFAVSVAGELVGGEGQYRPSDMARATKSSRVTLTRTKQINFLRFSLLEVKSYVNLCTTE
jgi:hypothetical protein